MPVRTAPVVTPERRGPRSGASAAPPVQRPSVPTAPFTPDAVARLPRALPPAPAPPRTADVLPVQRAFSVRGVPPRRPAVSGADATARGPLPVVPLAPPPAAAPLTVPAVPASGGSAPSGPTVQRIPSLGSDSGSVSGRSTDAVAATVASTPEGLRPSPQPQPQPQPPAPPDPPPEYTAVPAGAFDPRELTEFQLDELVHRIIDRVTRLVRTELRMDRERIGRLRDPRA
ncbi:hypothetical protein ABZZ17_03670 [Streptomyces sp. NPDC006512]|uniref:hypothetical protein n=1 Tax=Streptomyces sp. NPDC006512 TaxID=3154307 RepID=UPI0033BDCFFB